MELGSKINVKVSAINDYGESPYSEVGGGAVIQLVPNSPINLVNILEITLDDRIGVSWEDGVSNGGSTIIDYQIWFDDASGDSNFIILASSLTQRQFTANNLYSGSTYSFKVKARNSVGFSELSDAVTILAA